MIIYARVLLRCMLWALPAASPLLSAQTPADPDLYIPPVLTVEASANGAMGVGLRRGMPTETFRMNDDLVIRQHREVETDLLLPMIFFEPASSTVPERYAMFDRATDTEDYTEEQQVQHSHTNRDNLAKYHEVLNVIGSRLRRHPGTTITLEGSYSTEPGENAGIGRERAEVVKEYLHTIWTIAPERMTILPPRRACDSADHLFRQEEARRVLIESESWLIHHPVRFTFAALDNSLIVFMLAVDPKESPALVSGMSVTITSGDDLLGTTALPVSPDSKDFRMFYYWKPPRSIDALAKGITFQLIMTLTDGTRRLSAPVTMPVRIVDWGREDEQDHMALFEHSIVFIEDGDDRIDDASDRPEVDASNSRAETPSLEERLALALAKGYSLRTVGFFAAGGTTLRRHQQMMLEQCIATLHSSDSNRNGQEEGERTLVIASYGEEGEIPETDPVWMAISSANARSARQARTLIFADPAFQASLVPVEPAADDPKDGATYFNEERAYWDDVERQIYGEYADIVTPSDFSFTHPDNDYSASERKSLDSVLRQRAAPVVDYIRSAMGDEIYDSIAVLTQQTRRFTTRMPLLFLPEERFYARRVTLELRRSRPDRTWKKKNAKNTEDPRRTEE